MLMPNVPPFNPGDEQRGDEAKLIELLDQHAQLELELKSQLQEKELLEKELLEQEARGKPVQSKTHAELIARIDATRKRIDAKEDEIIILVDKYFREALRPILLKKFGKVVGSHADGTVRYTQMVKDFFIKVLEHRHEPFWKAKTARNLRNWSSRVMTNQIIDHLRRKKLAPQPRDDLATFADHRQTHFEKYNDVRFEQALFTIQQWLSGSEEEQLMAKVLRHRYVDGMDYDEIAEHLEIDKKRLYRIAEEAKKALRDHE
jgi:RNA polymerase sigma factor (sigma-70 family)